MKIEIGFSDKTVCVIGGTSGINLGVAEAFAQAGARVAVASRSREKVDRAVEKLKTYGGDAFGFVADVRDIEAVRLGLTEVHARFGVIDVLVSGAAGNFPAAARDMSANGFKAVMDIDVLGTFNVLTSAYPFLVKPDAVIINISAPQATVPMELQAHVCAAKAGVDMLTRVLALEWGPEGVRVNSIMPGPIAGTEGMKRLAPTPELMRMTGQSVPLRRNGTIADIAHAALFLASPFARYINGAVLPVDGGWSLGGAAELSRALTSFVKPKG